MLKISEEPPMVPPGVSSIAELSGKWWIAHTKSRFEKAFARDLLHRGIGYFLPLVRRVKIIGGKKRQTSLPLFPSYVFFCGNEESRTIAMKTNRICQTIEATDQEKLLSECISIERALAGDARLDPCQGVSVGQRYRVVAGPFRDIEGTVIQKDGRNRIVLEISILGLGASLEIEADLLEPISGC
ncbi:MAG: transcription termination/antitermination NusG family protein [Planctomycetota bacterium]|nr:transcription termination/antitermination NusG family protein [Planctomycetota bacterium]